MAWRDIDEAFPEVHDEWQNNKGKRSKPDVYGYPERRYNSLVEEVWHENKEDFDTMIRVLESKGFRITKS